MTNPGIAGNLYVYGTGKLGKSSVAGDAVIDLDADNNGVWVGLTPATLGNLVRSPAALPSTLTAVMNDIKIGVNGTTSTNVEVVKDRIELDITTGNGSVYWVPNVAPGGVGEFGFAAQNVNPFDGTPFAAVLGGMHYGLNGYIRTNGDFHLTGSAASHYSLNLGLTTLSLDQSFGVDFSKTGSILSLGTSYHAGMTIGNMSWLGAQGSIDGWMTFTVNSSTGATSLSGSATVSGTVVLFGISGSMSFGVSFTSTGFTLALPGALPDVYIGW